MTASSLMPNIAKDFSGNDVLDMIKGGGKLALLGGLAAILIDNVDQIANPADGPIKNILAFLESVVAVGVGAFVTIPQFRHVASNFFEWLGETASGRFKADINGDLSGLRDIPTNSGQINSQYRLANESQKCRSYSMPPIMF